ncbi:MAG: ATP-binding protein [Thermomicrobiales bacterium]
MTADPVPEELQRRAIEALRFGVEAGMDFHVVAVGNSRVEMDRYIHWLLNSTVEHLDPCCDWCYVMNFGEPDHPRAIRVPSGEAREFKLAIERAIEDLRVEIPKAFEAEPYEERRRILFEGFAERRDKAFEELGQRARSVGFAVIQSQAGLGLVPIAEDHPMQPEEFAQLPKEEQERLNATRIELNADLERTLRTIREIEREARGALRDLDRGIADQVVEVYFETLREHYAENESILSYLDEVANDITNHLPAFRQSPDDDGLAGIAQTREHVIADEFFRRYRVNVIVDHHGETSPTVLFEENPTYGNLVGRIERRGVMGTLVTDFTMIRPGALLKANQGFLILSLRDVLSAPFAWDGLKHALERKLVRIEELGQLAGTIATTSLEPEPIPLDIKVILLADGQLAAMAAALDPELPVSSRFEQSFRQRQSATARSLRLWPPFLYPSGTRTARRSTRRALHGSSSMRHGWPEISGG